MAHQDPDLGHHQPAIGGQGMSRKPLFDGQVDEEAYRDAEAHFQLVSEVLPANELEGLAKEVVKRLAFRMPQKLAQTIQPDPLEIEELCTALVSGAADAGDRMILAARADGVAVETIYVLYVAAAARRLGEMWENDEISFVDVTVASGRLYRIIRGLRRIIDRTSDHPMPDRHVLFGLVPGETHTLGIQMAADVFRRRNWDVEMAVGDDHDVIVRRTEVSRFAAIVLIANSERRLSDLISLVLSLRITQPMAHIVVAGNIVTQVEQVDRLVGADAVLHNIETAVTALETLIEDR